jgi:protein arginine N-methyltransferase 1
VSAYTVRSFGSMMADRVRTDSYAAALERTVRPGCVVLDVGTGTGILALLACRYGARHVYAIDPNNAIHVARASAQANGYADRITFIQAVSTEVRLPERADVAVADLRGVLPVHAGNIQAMADVRERLLAPGGVVIPRTDTIRGAPVQDAEAYGRITAPWTEHGHGFHLSAAREAALNDWGKVYFAPEQLLADAATWAVLDYRATADPNVTGTMEWTVARAGTGHGVSVWFDADLAEGVGFTTGAHGPRTIYGTAFLPWLQPVELAEGDRVSMRLDARLASGEYVWVWNTDIRRGDGAVFRFRQSTLQGVTVGMRALRMRAHDFAPVLAERGRVDQRILEMMDGTATLGEIASELQRRYPDRFPDWKSALSRAGQLSELFAEGAEPGLRS